jgi:hypothetical protein
MAAVFAFACALLIPPPTTEGNTEFAAIEDAQFSPESSLPIPQPSHTKSKQPKTRDVPAPKKQWGNDINWPKEWTTQGSLPGKDDKDPQT